MISEWGVYVHVPWCRVRCPYCAFEIVPLAGRPVADSWRAGVLADVDRWEPLFTGSPATLYIGGGTPSRLAVADLAPVIERVGAPDVTIECNPEDLTAEWLEAAVGAGMTRVSLGVQSMDRRLQRTVGRGHHQPERALALLAGNPHLSSWSADLMFALPGQTLQQLDADLDALLAYDPPHVSLYGLTVEPGTGYARLDERGRLALPDEDLWVDMHDRIAERLEGAGLERYEISNFAVPGHQSRHNRMYWNGSPYLGAGPSAHGWLPDGRRTVNPPHAGRLAGIPPSIETPSPLQAATDGLISGLRGRHGLPLGRLAPFTLDPDALQRLVAGGLLVATETHISLTRAGIPVADGVIRTLAAGIR